MSRQITHTIIQYTYTQTYQRILQMYKILKLSDQYKLQVSNYVFQVLHSNIDEEIKSSLLNHIHSDNTRIIIYHDFLPTPRRGSHVKSGKTDTQTSSYTP